MRRLTKVGLTGGIATGKSTTLKQWREAGAAVIDADELAHDALTPDYACVGRGCAGVWQRDFE